VSGRSWIELAPGADPAGVRAALQGLGLWAAPFAEPGGRRGLAVGPGSAAVAPERVRAVAGVAAVLTEDSPHPAVDAQAARPVAVSRRAIGPGEPPLLMAGPCAVETPEQVAAAADLVAAAGGHLLRGGAFKPRTSPYAFAGHGRPALAWLADAARARGLGVVTEVLGEADVAAVAEVADLLQVGARNMQNFALLREVGRAGRPVLLKRGLAATTEEWLLAGEHLLAAGAPGVVFCERGIRSFDPGTRNVLDLGAVALLARVLGQPVVADPSHAAGRPDLVVPLGRAALAAGAHGLLVEVHPDPSRARCDGPQALAAADLEDLAAALGSEAAPAPAGAHP